MRDTNYKTYAYKIFLSKIICLQGIVFTFFSFIIYFAVSSLSLMGTGGAKKESDS